MPFMKVILITDMEVSKLKKAVLLALILVMAATGWSMAEPRLSVAVSIIPQKFFVEKIGGDLVDVTVIVPKGASPATYEPKPSQMADLGRCSLWFSIGVPFERAQKDRLLGALPNLRDVPTQDGLKLSPMGHHHDGEPRKEAMDPHVWLSPSMVMIQARAMAAALSEADGKNRDFYMANYVRFVSELAELDASLATSLSGLKGKAFMVFHPSWGYFARDYGLVQMAVEVEGKEPKPAELAKIVEEAKSEGISTVFVQPQFSMAAAETLAKSIEGEVVPLDPLAEDWSENLVKAAEILKKAAK